MSNIYNQEPQAYGLITFKTTFGDLDIELFTKQCPKATRFFIESCLSGLYEGTIFDRVEKDFIAFGGVDTNEFFPDEFHSRLRFTRRGLIATANTKKNSNGSKFFFTLGITPELQDKHTIFGRVKGNSIYNLVELNQCQVDHNFRPYSEKKILQVLVIDNPLADVTAPRPRTKPNQPKIEDEDSSSDSDDPLRRPKVDPSKTKKLSFYPDDDDDDDDDEDENGDSSSEAGHIESKTEDENKPQPERQASSSPGVQGGTAEVSLDQSESKSPKIESEATKEEKLRAIRAQIQNIKERIEDSDTRTLSERRRDSDDKNVTLGPPGDSDATSSRVALKRSRSRERETIELVTNFKKKLKEVSKYPIDNSLYHEKRGNDELSDELAGLDRVDGDEWLRHKFDEVKDTKDDSLCTIDDSRNRMYKNDRLRDHRSDRRNDSKRHDRRNR